MILAKSCLKEFDNMSFDSTDECKSHSLMAGGFFYFGRTESLWLISIIETGNLSYIVGLINGEYFL
jgi:hypothetical protein